MSSKIQLIIFVSTLLVLGFSAVLYKHFVLGFPLVANADETVWKIEAQLSFEANAGETRLLLNAVNAQANHKVAFIDMVAPEFSIKFVDEIIDNNKIKMLELFSSEAEGLQDIYVRYDMWFLGEVPTDVNPYTTVKYLSLETIDWPKKLQKEINLLQQYYLEIKTNQGDRAAVLSLLSDINTNHPRLNLVLRDKPTRLDKIKFSANFVKELGIESQMVRGIYLQDMKRSAPLVSLLQLKLDGEVVLFETRELDIVPLERFIILQQGSEPLFELYGGKNFQMRLSTLKEKRGALQTALETSLRSDNALVDFSIYSLPIKDQSTFKLLLLIPLGALVVVVLRNLVGLRTSGTFMPILIALVFLQTQLLVGLSLFLIVVGVGLTMRYWLSSLNLLLVPRIASVLVFVIIIFAAIGIASHKLNIEWGTQVTFFPMIILSWTIERMSVLWEEEGGHEVFIQGGGSLLTASLAYFVMSNHVIADTVFLFPEILLILLAVIITIGSYSGYRLSDLGRFEPMQRF